MHLKCIHELCTIILIFHSYLHHIRGILLLFNDFWYLIMISPIYGINPAQVEKPYFFPYLFQGLNDVIISYKFMGIIFFGRRKTEERRKEANGGLRAKRGCTMRPLYLAAWAHLFWDSWLRLRRSFFPKLTRDLKIPI